MDTQREQAKHICMELTADGARVTNLSLSGTRLVLTIEAELSDSQLKATDQALQPMDARPQPVEPGEVRSDTEFLDRENAGISLRSGGEGGRPPAPSVAFQPGQTYPMCSDTIRREIQDDDVTGAPEVVASEDDMDETIELHGGAYQSPSGQAMVESEDEEQTSHADTQPIEFAGTPSGEMIPVAPPLEPVRELTDTWDATHDSTTTDGVFQRQAEREEQAAPEADPVQPLLPPSIVTGPAAAAPGVLPPEIHFTDPFSPAPAVPPHNVMGGDITLGDDPLPPAWNTGPAPVAFPGEPKPLTETWDGSDLSVNGFDTSRDDQPAISEESSAIGGSRHGEPQPTLSFGTVPPLPPSPQISLDVNAPETAPSAPIPPMAPPSPAVSAGPAVTPGFDFAPPASDPAALQPSPAPLAPEPSRPEPSVPVMTPLSISGSEMEKPGSEEMTVVGPSPFARDAEKLHIPSPLSMPSPAPVASPASAPEPAPAPTPAPAPEAAKDSASSQDTGESGGTTVLIRYTCPKCKTQGMQAVDKVGTVVNCSNCGKAMRLVMKK